MSDSDLPIALRPLGEFPLGSNSIFEDPGDEKSWHQSQRDESLGRFYEGRDSSWYASAIRPLAGAERVLDLGCGPGLTLEALLEQGATTVLGVDRWPRFAREAPPHVPIALHDLTLPMPFLASGSFDAVLSHYALDYVSPIGMRQVLREAHRVLSPGGSLLIYIAAVGLGSGDQTRTSPYGPETMRQLLAEAGFGELEVEGSPNGRNTVASGRRAQEQISPPDPAGVVEADVLGEMQLSAGLSGVDGEQIEIVAAGQPEATLRLELPSVPKDGRIGVCARLVTPAAHGVELQAWAWQDGVPVAAESLRLEARPVSLRLQSGGLVDHVDRWSPEPLALEPGGSAYVPAAEAPDAREMDEAGRGAEGRLLVVEEDHLDGTALARAIGAGRNRLLIRRALPSLSVAALDRDWLDDVTLGVVVDVEQLTGDEGLAFCLWAGARQALLMVEGGSWEEIDAALRTRLADLLGPVLAVDPHLRGGPARRLGAGLADLARSHPGIHPVLGTECRELTDQRLLGSLEGQLLCGGSQVRDAAAGEALRLLTERTLLMRLRRVSGRRAEELGRRHSLG
jgi:SAM-dependent methyltransferase